MGLDAAGVKRYSGFDRLLVESSALMDGVSYAAVPEPAQQPLGQGETGESGYADIIESGP